MKQIAKILSAFVVFICLYFISISPILAQTLQGNKKDVVNNKDSIQPVELMLNLSSLFYDVSDLNIDRFLTKYKYTHPCSTPVGLRLELLGIPLGGRMIYGINAGTIVSRQDIATADISLAIFYRLLNKKHIWILSGLSVGEHFDRIVLTGLKPASLDSVAEIYKTNLSLHRNGLILEPSAKVFWFPLKTGKYQVGLFTGIYYDFDFNSHWRVGYYPHNGHSFKNLKKPSTVGTSREFGWVFSMGLSFCF
jgi:hypothetical protein